jgi:transcriptional regulator with XRE-family HTH domain
MVCWMSRGRVRRRTITDADVEAVVVRTLEDKPTDATHWSTRDLAKKAGVSASSVGRIWRAFGLKPWIADTFQLSEDPLFVEKVRDVVGLYINPPERAVVLCVDEKTSIQALDRSQPILPMRPGQVERRTHDYKRNGVTDLFAALNLATGQVVHQTRPQHRAIEFRKFLDAIDNAVPAGLDAHVVLDNSSTFHFTSTSSSWLNLVKCDGGERGAGALEVFVLEERADPFVEAGNDGDLADVNRPSVLVFGHGVLGGELASVVGLAVVPRRLHLACSMSARMPPCAVVSRPGRSRCRCGSVEPRECSSTFHGRSMICWRGGRERRA